MRKLNGALPFHFEQPDTDKARRIDIDAIILNGSTRSQWRCRTCCIGERIVSGVPARVINRATLHNILAHRDGFLIKDNRYVYVDRNRIRQALQNRCESNKAYQEAGYQIPS